MESDDEGYVEDEDQMTPMALPAMSAAEREEAERLHKRAVRAEAMAAAQDAAAYARQRPNRLRRRRHTYRRVVGRVVVVDRPSTHRAQKKRALEKKKTRAASVACAPCVGITKKYRPYPRERRRRKTHP